MLPPTAQPSSTSGRSVPATATGVPPALANLPEGARIEGVVAGHDTAGHALLRTEAGILILASRLDLPRASVVTLRIEGGPTFAATIEAVDGRSPETAGPPSPPPLARPAVSAGLSNEAPVAGNLLATVVVSPPGEAEEAMLPAATLTAIEPGVRLIFRIVDTKLAVSQPTGTLPGPGLAAPRPGAAAGLTPGTTPSTATPEVPAGGPPVVVSVPAAGALRPAPAGSPAVVVTPDDAHRVAASPTNSPPSARGGPVPSAPSPAAPSRALSSTPSASASIATPASPAATTSLAATASGIVRPQVGTPSTPTATTTAPALGNPASTRATANDSPAQPKAAPPAGALAAARATVAGTTAPTIRQDGGGGTAGQTGTPPSLPTTGSASPAAPIALTTAMTTTTTIVATVVGADGAGRPLLNTPFGVLRFAVPAPIPLGSSLTLSLVEVEPLAPEAMAAAAPLGNARAIPVRDWPALRGILDALARIEPAVAEQVAQQAIAAPGRGLGGSILFFLSALRGGDLSGWLGRDAVRLLESHGRGELVRRLAADFGQLHRLAAPPPPGEWQPLFVPLHDGETLRQLRFYVRHGNGGNDDEADGATRFIVEVELSRLGDLQLDGFLHRARFDLVLRSRMAIPLDARRDIAAIFADGLAVAGLAGTVDFRVAETFPIVPLDDILEEDRNGLFV